MKEKQTSSSFFRKNINNTLLTTKLTVMTQAINYLKMYTVKFHQQTYTVFSILFLCTLYCTSYIVLSCTIYCTLHCVLSHCNFHVYFLCNWSHSTGTLLINFVFVEDLPSVSQSNVQAATAENEVHYTLTNIIYIKFQKCFFFLWGLFWRRCFYTVDICNGVHFFEKIQGLLLYQKFAPLQVSFKIFAQICSYL